MCVGTSLSFKLYLISFSFFSLSLLPGSEKILNFRVILARTRTVISPELISKIFARPAVTVVGNLSTNVKRKQTYNHSPKHITHRPPPFAKELLRWDVSKMDQPGDNAYKRGSASKWGKARKADFDKKGGNKKQKKGGKQFQECV